MRLTAEDLRDLNTVAGQVARLIPRDSRVAVVGQAPGDLPKRLEERGCHFTSQYPDVAVVDLDGEASAESIVATMASGTRLVLYLRNPHHASRILTETLTSASTSLPVPMPDGASVVHELEQRLRRMETEPFARARVFEDPFRGYREGSLPPHVEAQVLNYAEAWVSHYVVAATVGGQHIMAGAPSSPSVHVLAGHPLSDEGVDRLRLLLRTPKVHSSVWHVTQDVAAYCRAVDGPVLVLPKHMEISPTAIQVLHRAYLRRESPVGLGLVDATGRVVHAGATTGGRAFGAGARSMTVPVFTADREHSGLLPPFMAPATFLRKNSEVVIGRYLGESPARLGVSVPPTPGARPGVRALYRRTALVLTDAPPHRLDHPLRAMIIELLRTLLEAGATPILSWKDEALANVRSSLSDLEREGVVLFGGDGYFDMPSLAERELLLSPAESLAVAFDPDLVVFLTAERMSREIPGLLEKHPRAWRIGTDVKRRIYGEVRSLDTQITNPEDLPSALQRPLAGPPPATDPDIAVIERRERVAGMTSIIIPVWNLWSLTARCLDSLQEHTTAKHEIIVVDNGSSDGTPEELRSRQVQVLTNRSNLGFARACNQGLQAARGEQLCILNNDTEVRSRWLEEMTAVLKKPGTGMVGPRSNRISGLQAIPDAPGMEDIEAARRWAEDWSAPRRGRSWLVNRLVGFCLLARGDVLEAVGGFDAGVGLGNFEDDELCGRVQNAGHSLRVADGVVVLHHGSATFETAGLDYSSALAAGARHTMPRLSRRSSLATALVLSDSSASEVAQTVRTTRLVADHAVVLERGDLTSTELRVAGFGPRNVTVIDADWKAAPPASLVDDIGQSVALVVYAGEQVQLTDWGLARAEIEANAQAGARIMVDGEPQPRLLGRGGVPTATLQHCRLRRQPYPSG